MIEIDQINNNLPKELSRFQYMTYHINNMIKIENIGFNKIKPTKISLYKWKNGYTINFGIIHDGVR